MAGPVLQVDDAGNVWDVSSGKPTFVHGPQSGGAIQTKAADPDASLNHQLKALQLQKAIKDAAKEQVDDKQIHALAQLYASNKLIPPTRPNEVAQKAIAEAMTIDPNYDPELSANRLQAIKDFSGAGKAAQGIAAANRLAENLQELKSISDRMGGPNLHVKALNHIVAGVEQQGEPELVSRYNALLPEIANQFDLIMKSNKGTSTVSGTEEVRKGLAPARSQVERDAAFQEVAKAIHGAITPYKDQWNSAYGGTKAPPMWVSKSAGDFFSSIDPEHSDDYGGNDWRGLPGLKGDGTPGQATPLGGMPPPGGGGSPPTIGGGGTPHADYSNMVGGPQAHLATGASRTVLDPIMAQTVSAFIKKGIPYDTAQAFAQSHGASIDPKQYAAGIQFAQQHGGATNVQASHEVPTTLGERLATSPVSAAIAGGAAGATAGLSDVAGRAIAGPEWDANRAALAATNPTSDLIGNVAGGAGAMALGGGLAAKLIGASDKGANLLAWALKNPVKAAAPGDALYGSTYGASENPDNPLAGAAGGAVAGGIGGFVGSGLAKGAGAALQGVTDPAVQRLRALGIPLTAGEVLGGGFKKAQDAMTSVFGPGNMVARRYADGRQALNRAAFNEAGGIIGQPIDAVGQKGIQALDTAKSQAYENALSPVSVDLNTPEALAGIGDAINAAKAIPNVDSASDVAASGLDNYINGSAPGGIMSGRDFQQAYRGLSRLGRQSSNRIYGHEIGDALGQGQDAITGALQAQNPGAFDAFLAANRANRHLSVLSKAVDAAKNQIGDNGEPLFTPAQLGTAASANGRTYNGLVSTASGNRPFNQLAMDAQKVMSSKLPESGTIPRAIATGAILSGGTGLGYGANGGEGAAEGAAIPLALLSVLGTRAGQQLLTSALIKRTVADQAAGRYLSRTPQIGGGVLTAAGVPLLTGP